MRSAADHMTAAAAKMDENRDAAAVSQKEALKRLQNALQRANEAKEMLERLKAMKRAAQLLQMLKELRSEQKGTLATIGGVADKLAEKGMTRAMRLKLLKAEDRPRVLSARYRELTGVLEKAEKPVFAYLWARSLRTRLSP
ncbi:MAG: hypothetical protein U5N86_11705 [Planctomycetota bacterium]|nr:hypothetical protein [Planctomycetota bacterium]